MNKEIFFTRVGDAHLVSFAQKWFKVPQMAQSALDVYISRCFKIFSVFQEISDPTVGKLLLA